MSAAGGRSAQRTELRHANINISTAGGRHLASPVSTFAGRYALVLFCTRFTWDSERGWCIASVYSGFVRRFSIICRLSPKERVPIDWRFSLVGCCPCFSFRLLLLLNGASYRTKPCRPRGILQRTGPFWTLTPHLFRHTSLSSLFSPSLSPDPLLNGRACRPAATAAAACSSARGLRRGAPAAVRAVREQGQPHGELGVSQPPREVVLYSSGSSPSVSRFLFVSTLSRPTSEGG